jgi:hypothetical protein
MSSSQQPNFGIRDNHSRGTAGDFLKPLLKEGTTLSVVSAYFTMHAYHALKQDLNSIQRLRFLFGEPTFVSNVNKGSKESREFKLTEDGLTLRNQLKQKKEARECAEWIKEKVDIRSIKQAGLLHGKLYHVKNGEVTEAMLGSSNFTVPGLGLRNEGNNVELNLVVSDTHDRNDLLAWFEEWWNEDELTKDVKDVVLQELARL